MPLRVQPAEPGSFTWHLVDRRGRVVAIAVHTYPEPADAAADAERFRTTAPDAPGPDAAAEPRPRFVSLSRDEAATWTFFDDDGALARSATTFDGKAALEAAVARVRALLRDTTHVERAPGAFDPEVLDHVLITLPLQEQLAREAPNKGHRVIVELDHDYVGGMSGAHSRVMRLVNEVTIPAEGAKRRSDIGNKSVQSHLSHRYVIANLTGRQIRDLVEADARPDPSPRYTPEPTGEADSDDDPGASAPRRSTRAIYRIWPDFRVRPLLTESKRTVKADAAHAAFAAHGRGMVWAVVDSGVDAAHPHFAAHQTLDLPPGLAHKDFVEEYPERATEDPFGHGTHVAGIIAGESGPGIPPGKTLYRLAQEPDAQGEPVYRSRPAGPISGLAPQCKILSVRVLDAEGLGHASDVIAALQYVGSLNKGGRDLRVHGVNLSVGYDFDAEWYACGHSPLCREVDLLVRTGVVVVAAAGNTGYGTAHADARTSKTGIDVTINDPGNAERAITVGATHRAEPHRYGVSYFSSKGPTGDGRAKPDLVAPGERVLSCAAGRARRRAERKMTRQAERRAEATGTPAPAVSACHYVADSGTSMAAPHVSGAVAAFLSVRSEFVGRPEEVKALFLRTATDLGRDRYFQGHGLIDLMRALQDV